MCVIKKKEKKLIIMECVTVCAKTEDFIHAKYEKIESSRFVFI